MIDQTALWIVIGGLAVGSFLLRYAFIGFVGNRPMPPWLLRHLRYTAVAILPALVTPQVLWPAATGGSFDVPRMAAAIATVALGYTTKNVLISIFGGAATLYGLLWLAG
ncbi:AzlD domain-containing protein [Sulfitobacter sp. D35]|uniref:AzlD domain-containing protein n=1 Tax=Sulfitobacter sp. D35 TaxID=3083252 RepID=UPI00296EC027|nr:AzlD domain-containing protein [Sulfitobacter sp. D35]MDW4499781.1 AzlD domain-containing protein [Sulfitobacter sp. D35]